MSKRNSKRNKPGWIILAIFLGLADLAFVIRYLLQGHNVAMFNTKGLVAKEQLGLMTYSAVILLVIAIPSVSLLYYTAWKYRESNPKAAYDPDKKHGRWFNIGAWGIPTVFMLVLAIFMWSATHQLVPQKTILADTKPLRIQVISMRWKWLFIYPEQKIATVNFVQVPLNTPVEFDLTADEAPMSSFWIPNLGGQLYSMTGHVNRLNLMADTSGDYPGSSAEINGAGFSGMKFTARASTVEGFDAWVRAVKESPDTLDADQYEKLLKPTEKNPAAFYSAFTPGLYDRVIMKYTGSHDHQSSKYEGNTH